jgi:hypothetical protein
MKQTTLGAPAPSMPTTEPSDSFTETAKRTQTAVALALEASAVAARTIIDAFMNGEEPSSSSRYLLSLGWNAETKAFDKARVEVISHDAFIMSWDELIHAIGEPNHLIESAVLAGLAKACAHRLKSRFAG